MRVSVSRDDIAGLLQRLDVGRRAVGQAALGPQHAVEAVGALAAENLHREIAAPCSRGCLRGIAMLPTRISVWTASGLVDDDEPARRRRRLDRRRRGSVDPRPRRRTPAPPRQTPRRPSTSPTIARIMLLAPNHGRGTPCRSSRVSAASDLGVPLSGPPVRMEPVDEAVEDDVGDVVRVVVADPAAPRAPAAAAARFPRARTPGCCATSASSPAPTLRLSFITTALTKVRSVPGAGAERAADRIDLVRRSPRPSASSSPDRAATRPGWRRPACPAGPARRRRGPAAAG